VVGGCDSGAAADSTLFDVEVEIDGGQMYLTDEELSYLREAYRATTAAVRSRPRVYSCEATGQGATRGSEPARPAGGPPNVMSWGNKSGGMMRRESLRRRR